MRLEIFILGITIFFIYNAYNDGKYTKILLSYKKYYKMIFFALLGIGIYLLLKRNPSQGQKLLLYANNALKFMPIDKSSLDMLSPIMDFTNTDNNTFMQSFNNIETPYSQKMEFSGKNGIGGGIGGGGATKRAVSETKKKIRSISARLEMRQL